MMENKTEIDKERPLPHGPPNKFIHQLKGPAHLTPVEIKDILESRPKKFARKMMADKYGISEKRVVNLWKSYYGGNGTMQDYSTGLKKEIPNTNVQTSDINLRKIKTERGTYSAKEPKAKELDKPSTRAAPVRKMPASHVRPKSTDLNLDIDTMTDDDAQIIAGEISAGNNNSELIDVMTQLIKSNKKLSKTALTSLKMAQASYTRSRHGAGRNSTSFYSESDIGETDNDDSTVYTSETKHSGSGPRPLTKQKYVARDSTRSESSESNSDSEFEDRRNTAGRRDRDNIGKCRVDDHGSGSADSVRLQRLPDMDRYMELDKGLRVRAPGSSGRARPIYKTERERPELSPESTDYLEDSGHEQEVHPAKYNPRKGPVQQDNPRVGDQLSSKPRQSYDLPWAGGNRPSKDLAEISGIVNKTTIWKRPP